MYTTILVPLDRSEAAEIVLPYAVEIAAKMSPEIVVASVSETTADVDNVFRSYLERVKERLRQELKEYGSQKEPGVFSKILVGSPASELLRYAEEVNASLLVMASRGSSGRGPWVLGSIADKILRATKRPILLVRTPVNKAALLRKRLITKVLVPLDGSKVGEAALPHAEILAQALGAEIVLFQAVEPMVVWPLYITSETAVEATIAKQGAESRRNAAEKYLEHAREALKAKGLKASLVVDWGHPAERIIDYAAGNGIDLVAMPTHGRSGISRWVFGSVTDKVLHAGDTPVLVVRPTK